MAVAHVDAQRRGQEQDRHAGSFSAKFPSFQQWDLRALGTLLHP